jgi:hypothetical protein
MLRPSLASRQKLGDDLGRSGPEISRKNAAQKEKGRNRGQAAVSPKVIIPKLKHFASAIFKKSM